MTRPLFLVASLLALASISAFAQSPEFSEPWKNPNIAIAIDPYEKNEIDWEKLATDPRVVAIIHRATIADRVDRLYEERKVEAKRRGYKWGAYHVGRPGDPIKQADFFLDTVGPAADDLIALDLESTDATKDMSLADARIFIKRIKEKTGRYPLVYANNEVTKAIAEQFRADEVFARTRLWYARFKRNVTDFRSAPGRHIRSGNFRANRIARKLTARLASTQFRELNTIWMSMFSTERLRS
jgi:lysozyme